MHKVVGVDPSTKTGLFFTGQYTSSTVLKTGKVGVSRLFAIREAFSEFLDAHKPDIAVVEGYAYANKYTLTLLVEIGIILRLELCTRGIPCYIVPPSVLKKYVTGKGNSKKPEVAEAAKSRWGFEDPSDDVVDAYVLAVIGRDIAEGRPVKGVELLT